MSNDRKPLVLYHALCSDGAGAAYAAWCAFGEAAEYSPVATGDSAPTVGDVEGRDVYVLDMSFSRGDLVAMQAAAKSLVVIDHHESAERTLAGLPFVTFSREHSGAILTWKYFHGENLSPPLVLKYIEDRDLWKWALEGSREVSAALEAYGVRGDFRKLITIEDRDPHLELLYDQGTTIVKAQDQYVDAIVGAAETVCLDEGVSGAGIEISAANTPILQSEVAARLARESESGMAVAWFCDGRSGRYRLSFRSVGEQDVACLAECFGGGGHKNSAGVTVDELPWTMVGPFRR